MTAVTDQDAATGRRRLLVGLALFASYFIWGSTYLGLRYGLEGFPPFLLNGIRMTMAGGALYAIARRSGAPRPTPRQWVHSGVIGALMFIGGLGLVTIAEDNGVGSGLAASAVAVMPLWVALWAGMLGSWPTRMEWAGLVVGFAGVALLSQEGDFQSTPLGTILLIVAPMLWAFGSVIAPRLSLPKGAMGTAAQMATGGVLLLAAGLVRGETIGAMPSLRAWLALGYLTVFGSLIAYTAYVYLLQTVRHAVATSYAYVNPVVAVGLGVWIGGEVVTGWTAVGLPVILAGVGLVGLAQRRRRRSVPSALVRPAGAAR